MRNVSDLILHPDVQARRGRVDALRLELARAFDDRVRLEYDEIPALRHRYAERFGALEARLQERTLDLKQRQRMVELFALKIDRGEKLDAEMVALVMKAVANQFGEIRGRVRRQVARDDRRQDHGTARVETTDDEGLTPRQKQRECHRLFRRLAWRLHPDSLAGDDALSREYWDLSQSAYTRGDVGLLRTLHHLVAEVGEGYAVGLQAIDSQERRLRSAIASERRRIASIVSGEPYTLREVIDSEEWVAERRAELDEELASIEKEIDTCNEFLDPILEIAHDASPPDVAADVWSNFVETMYFSGR